MHLHHSGTGARTLPLKPRAHTKRCLLLIEVPFLVGSMCRLKA